MMFEREGVVEGYPPSLCSLCSLSHLSCNRHSTLLATYLHRIGQDKTSSCSNCGSESQDMFHLLLVCPALDSLCLAIFGHSLTILDLWSCPWEVEYWDSAELIRPFIPRNGSVSPPPPPSPPAPTPPTPHYTTSYNKMIAFLATKNKAALCLESIYSHLMPI